MLPGFVFGNLFSWLSTLDPLISAEQFSLFFLSHLSSNEVSSEKSKDRLNSSEELLGASLDKKYFSTSSVDLSNFCCCVVFFAVEGVDTSSKYWSASGRSENEYSISGQEWTLSDEDCSDVESGVMHAWEYFRFVVIFKGASVFLCSSFGGL